MKKVLVGLILVLLFPIMVWGANTVTLTGNALTISSIDSDWDWSDTFTSGYSLDQGIKIHSIQFNPAAAGDACIIYNGSASDPDIFNVSASDSDDQKIKYYDGLRFTPFLDFSAGTFTAGSSITIIFDRRN